MARVSYGSRANLDTNFPNPQGSLMSSSMPRGPCSSLEELVSALEEEISAGAKSLVPECTTSELCLDLSAVLPLRQPNIGPYADGGSHDLPPEFKVRPSPAYSRPQATVAAIISINDPHVRAIVQRAASRGIVASIEALDGFKYSFNNAWGAKDEDGQRFSYICQDSMQNKDRHANGFTRTQKHLKGEGERGVRKPTFDCKGSISVKCSASRRCVDVYYRHYAIHGTALDRNKPSQPSRPVDTGIGQSAVQASNQNGNTRGLLGELQAEKSAYGPPPGTQAPSLPNRHELSNIGRPLKRNRESDAPVISTSNDKPLSLVDLLNQSQAAKSLAPSPVTPKTAASAQPPPVAYDLPSWAPRPAPAPVPSNTRKQANPSKQQVQPPPRSSQFSAPYPPPYQPIHSQHYQQPSGNQPVPPSAQVQPVQPPQEIFGAPKEIHPQGQGLFTTLKAVPRDPTSLPPTQPAYVEHQRRSCFHCRHGKKKCDEQRPICGSCQRLGKYDCAYEPPYSFAPIGPWQRWPPAPIADMAPAPPQPQMARQESPDPWFPKR